MPDYYTQRNSVLGPRPIPHAAPRAVPSTLMAGVIVVLCLAAVAAMLYRSRPPVPGAAPLNATVAYLVVEFDDGATTTASGFVASSDGRVVTSRRAAFPRGPGEPPARYRVFLNSGLPSQREYLATVVARGDEATEPAGKLKQDWAVLKLVHDGAALNYLTAEPDPAALLGGAAIKVCGYDPSAGSFALVALDEIIANKVEDGGAVARFSYRGTIPPGLDGGPVIDAASGRVLALNLSGVEAEPGVVAACALPIGQVSGLSAAASAP